MPITHEYEDEALPSTPSHVQAKHEYEDELSLEDTAATLENLSLSNPPAQGGGTLSSDYTIPHSVGTATAPEAVINPRLQLDTAYQQIVASNYSSALSMLENITTPDQPLVCILLGQLYEEFLEPIDREKAVTWYEKAQASRQILVAQAQAGDRLAQYGLGVLGTHAPQATLAQCTEGVSHYRQAMAQEDGLAAYQLGLCYQQGKGVVSSATTAVEMYQKAKQWGCVPAFYQLGLCYEKGEGVKQDLSMAFTCYQVAANAGYASAQNSVGACYENGQGIQPNALKAISYYEKAAQQGSLLALHNLGVVYENSRPGIPKDLVKAVNYYTLAATKGFARSQNNLARFYETGQGGIPQNLNEAARYYRLSADQGYARAQYNLGVCYERGQGVEKNFGYAKHYYTLAARANERITPTAQQNLERLLQTYPHLKNVSATPPTPFWSSPASSLPQSGTVNTLTPTPF